MVSLKFQVVYKNRFYEFEEGLQVFIFHLGIAHNVDKKFGLKALIRYVKLTCRCIDADSNTPQIENFAMFVANNWRTAEDMDTYDILEWFYDYSVE